MTATKVAVVSGAAQGIGRWTAELLAARGYALALADRGPRKALLDNPNFLQGLNVCRGMVTYQAVANDLGYEFVDPARALAT